MPSFDGVIVTVSLDVRSTLWSTSHMFEERKAHETQYGYIQITEARDDGFLLPNPHLIRLLMKNPQRGKALHDALNAEVEAVCQEIRQADTSPANESRIQGIVSWTVSRLKPEFREEVEKELPQLHKAASLGLRLGLRDRHRIGERPPSVRILEYQAVEKFFPLDDTAMSFALMTAVHTGLYTARLGWA